MDPFYGPIHIGSFINQYLLKFKATSTPNKHFKKPFDEQCLPKYLFGVDVTL